MSCVLRGVAVAAVLALLAGPQVGAEVRSEPTTVAVIVQAPGAMDAALAAVRTHGGTVTRALPIVDGFAATVPATAEAMIAATHGVRAVTRDTRMSPTKGKPPSTATTAKSVYRAEIGADPLARAGGTGAGVRVALVDTGIDTAVAATGDLRNKVVAVADPTSPLLPPVACVNFSGELDCDDTFGHGTFMAGLIAGSGAASGGKFAGVARDAQIVSVKVGGADGSADVSKVLAGIQWVVSFADTYDIRVLNLSLGTDSQVPPELDPLNLAVRRAWVAGLTVVVSAGNYGQPETGASSGTITKPGDDPFVITVGAVDDLETTKIADDRLPAFSSWGPTAHGAAKPDLVAPGARLISLRAPGSVIDTLPGTVDATYRRGSGTSMAAAVVSGLSAQLLDARPAWLPDDVKAALMAGAQPVASDEPAAVGAGLVNGPAATKASISPTYRTDVLAAGTGSLDGSRATIQVLSCITVVDCMPLIGEFTAQGRNWQGAVYAAGDWTSQTWYASQWADPLSTDWQTSLWATGRNWQGRNWQGSSWYDQTDSRSYGTPIDGSGSYGVWGG
jgi:serine protease AprX